MGKVARSYRGRSARQGARGAWPVTMTSLLDAADGMPAAHLEPPVGEGPVEFACKMLSEAALIIMLVVIGADIFTRYVLNFSFEIADELGGSSRAVIASVSRSASQPNGAFHRFERLRARLTRRG